MGRNESDIWAHFTEKKTGEATSGLERNSSSLGLTYGKLRAQLEPEKAEKLSFLYRKNKK